jgi:MOSC domain-containing protein YiiM
MERRGLRGRLARINVSGGGVPKLPVASAEVSVHGVAGDSQRDLQLHGGADRALCLWSLDVIELLQREGHPIESGSTGENLTIAGLDWAALVPGVQLRVGGALLIEITSYAAPCRTIWMSFKLRRYGRISQKKHPGQSRLYARVLRGGRIAPGDGVEVVAETLAAAVVLQQTRDEKA